MGEVQRALRVTGDDNPQTNGIPRAEVLRENLTHAEADGLLGRDSAYTAQVEAFLRTLDPEVARALSSPP